MAEALVSAVLHQLTTTAIQSAQQEWKLLSGAEKDIKEVERNLRNIHGLLEDADQRQIKDETVRLWLSNVKEASYDMVDILDEWNFPFSKSTTDHRVNLFVTLKRKVISLILSDCCCPELRRLHNIAVRIKKVNEELEVIAKAKDRYQLITREIKQPRLLESTAFVDVSKLHGREDVKNKIVNTLLAENTMQTISIVGMGGIGKTALAQMIYNDDEIQKHFTKVIWVCISDIFDAHKIATSILESLGQSSALLSSLQSVLDEICRKIQNEKYFLVLDDVWSVDGEANWEPFKVIFRRGLKGSRVLVTTRKQSVAVGMESFAVNLEILPDEVCWSILSQSALGKDKDSCENSLKDVGMDLAKKCKGLPLTAKTLGGLLKWKRSKDEWESVLNRELWKQDCAHEYIFTPLLVSYYDLPSKTRPCLLYCVIFPKGYVMEKYELITHWMAHGYLNTDDQNGEMELLGEEYFNHLASRSFFQDFKQDGNGSIISCKMHDIVYDFIKFLVKDEISAKEVVSRKLDVSSSKVRHLSVINRTSKFPSIKGVEKLRSFVSMNRFLLKVNRLEHLLKGAKCLRLFQAKAMHSNLMDMKYIGRLIHLRYLNISGRLVKGLPEEVCELHYLQVLSVSDCISLEKLPDGIGKLIQLRYLITSNCDGLKYYPKGVAKLTSLRKLHPVIATACKDTERFSIGDLENLDFLQEELVMNLIGDTLDTEEAQRAKLHNKKHLKVLNIRGDVAQELLKALKPPPNLTMKLYVERRPYQYY